MRRARSKQNLSVVVLGLMFGWLTLTVAAQSTELNAGQPVTVTIAPSAPVELTFTVDEPNTTVRLSAIGIALDDETPPADTILEVLTEDYVRVAYADDQIGETVITDAHIPRLTLAEAGTYRVRVDTFNGVTDGQAEVLLEVIDRFDMAVTDEDAITRIKVTLPPLTPFVYPITLSADQIVTITARDVSRGLDPYLRLVSAGGDVLSENDDHDSDDLSLDRLDARIVVDVADDRDALIELREFIGRGGEFEILIAVEPATNP